ncbi:armadillo-type protein [Collybia nuda]|uniref:Armadillo-type protein n=1 Tax=Collybia nuda TaxID=64659 RepID=A0A9P6CD15_9AGAR|nr:armadillo-type protein [Collybia nuda]
MPGFHDIPSNSSTLKRKVSGRYATTQGEAEKASDCPAKYSADPHPNGKAEPEPGGGTSDVDETDGSNDIENDKPRSDAKIWSLYLAEAEEEAKQQAELWKTDLESLLLFAGLFAGVVASFVIDSRHDLQPQSKTEVLLADIRNALRNETNSQDMFELNMPTLWINGLWFTSLLITLFSATMGILAKSWVVKFIPVAKGQESDDAYQRWVRDERAKLWYLGAGITILPGLIHLALLLFSVGFGLQSVGDNSKLGWVVLALVFLGTIIYLGITIAPFYFPGIPCQTPLFIVFRGLLRLVKSKMRSPKYSPQMYHSWLHAPEKNDVLSGIWHTQLAGSARPSNVDAAIAELTQKKLNDKWWQRFIQWGTPEILRKRLRESMADGFQRDSLEILRDHLHALSGFVDYFKSDHERLKTELGVYLDPGNPLHRWNVFPEKIRALAFSVRTPILLACKKDYTASEVEELPWETMVHDMLPSHRRDFAMAACRGLSGDREKLRKVSALSIVVCIAKATVSAIGPKSEWGVEIKNTARKEAEFLGQRYLGKLFEEIAYGWRTLVLENINKTPSVINSDSRDISTLGGLVSQLGHLNAKVRTRAIATLEALSTDTDFRDAIESSIPVVAEIAANDIDQDVRARGMEALQLLANNGVFQDLAKQALLDSLRPPLEDFDWLNARRINTISNIATLVQRLDFRAAFPGAVGPLISYLIKLAVDGWDDEDIHDTGTKAIGLLVNDEGLQSEISLALSRSLRLEIQSLLWTQVAVMDKLVMLIQHFDLQDVVNPEIPRLVEMVMNGESLDIRIAMMKTLASLAQGDVLQNTILPELPKILDIAWDDIHLLVQASWIKLLLFLTNKGEFQDSVKLAIPTLLKMAMNDTGEAIHKAGTEALTLLAKDELLQQSINQSLPGSLEEALKDSDWRVRLGALNTLDRLIKDFEVQDTTNAIIQQLIHVVLNDDDIDVSTAGVKLLVTLSQDLVSLSLPEKVESAFKQSDRWNRVHIIHTFEENTQFRDIMQSAILGLVELAVNDEEPDVQVAGVKLVGSLVQNGIFQDTIKPMVLKIIASVKRPKDFHWRVRISWFEALGMLAKISIIQSSIEIALPDFVDIAIKDQDGDVRAAGIKSLASLAQYENFRNIIKPGLITIMDSTEEDHWLVRATKAEIYVTLAQISDFQITIETGIPKLADLVIKDDDEDVRVAGMNSLVTLAQDEKLQATSPTLRGAIKTALPRGLDSALKDAHWRVRLTWIEALVALAHSRMFLDYQLCLLIHSLYIPSADFRDNLQSAVPKLIKMTGSDEDNDVCRAGIKALTNIIQDKNLKLQDTIASALPKNLDSVFDNPGYGLRTGWCQILDILIHRPGEVRLGGTTETVIPRIVEISVRDADKGIRTSMVGLLAFLAQEDTKFRDTIRSILSKNLDSAFKMSDWEIRVSAIETLGALVQHSNFQDAVKSAMPQILKMALNDEDEDVREAAEESLNLLKIESKKGNISDAIILAVPSTVILATPEGHDIRRTIDSLLRLSGTPTETELVKSMAHVLTPMLSGDLWITRATAVEFFAALHEHNHFRHFIQSAIPGIITLALEDKEDNVRAAGIRSLANLAGEDVFRDKIKAILPQLIPLLETNHLRAPVTELISLLTVDETVRKDVISHIVNPLVNLKVGELYPDGLLDLLSRLIIDKRFDQREASDHVALSVTLVLLMQPHTASFRFRTATALWCNYGSFYVGRQDANFPEYLVELFLFTIFGRHVTPDEVNKWRLMGYPLSPIADSGSTVQAN